MSLIQHDVSGHLKQLGKGVIGFGRLGGKLRLEDTFMGWCCERSVSFFSGGRKSERKDGEMIEKSQRGGFEVACHFCREGAKPKECREFWLKALSPPSE